MKIFKCVLDRLNLGEQNKQKLPLITFQKDNVLLSLRSEDTRAKGWFKRMEKHIKALGEVDATIQGKPGIVKLDIRIQPEGFDAKNADALNKIGEEYKVEIMMSEFK